MRYYEDLEVGQTFESPREQEMAREAIVAFAREWDPQRYHVDEAAAQRSPVGRIFASALHSMAVAQKLAHESGVFQVLPVVGLGISDLAFPLPVVEGDRLRARVTVKDKRLSRSRPGQGLVTLLIELINQNKEVVMTYTITELVEAAPT